MPKHLNHKQEAFAQAVAAGHSASAAYVMAGFKANGGNAQRLRKTEAIAKRIEHIRSEIRAPLIEAARQSGITVAATLAELGRIGFSDIRQLFAEDGRLKPVVDWPDDIARAVASIEVVTKPAGKGENGGAPELEHIHKIRLWDKNSALDKIAKHLQMFVERKELTVGASGELAALMRKVVRAEAALPIGAQRSGPNLRVVSDQGLPRDQLTDGGVGTDVP